jgi:hypothetical protein
MLRFVEKLGKLRIVHETIKPAIENMQNMSVINGLPNNSISIARHSSLLFYRTGALALVRQTRYKVYRVCRMFHAKLK